MDAGLLAQYLIIALVTILSVVIVARSQFPAAIRKLRIAIALPLLRDGMPGWVKALGRRLAPAPRAGGSACGGCSSCD
jgi:hypothetical protein